MCGIVAVYGESAVVHDIYEALTVLQHRGQDASGILTNDGGKILLRKSLGLVRDGFEKKHIERLRGSTGIGHVRYPTAGYAESSAEAQPFYVNSPYGIGLAHNGNLINSSSLKERQLIRSTREMYEGQQRAANVLKPLLFAGLIVEGGVVSYDSNVKSGGEGARVFGIGVSQQYRTDQVTVAMRLIAVQTGEVLMTVTATKTIASFQTGADVFRFFDMRTKALEIESGVAINEPTNYAVRSAIEYAVLQMIEKGEAQKLWKYKIGEKE